MTKSTFITHWVFLIIVRILTFIIVWNTDWWAFMWVMFVFMWFAPTIWIWIVARHRLKYLGRSPRWTLFFLWAWTGLVPIIMCLSNKRRITKIYKRNGKTYEEIEIVDEREYKEKNMKTIINMNLIPIPQRIIKTV